MSVGLVRRPLSLFAATSAAGTPPEVEAEAVSVECRALERVSVIDQSMGEGAISQALDDSDVERLLVLLSEASAEARSVRDELEANVTDARANEALVTAAGAFLESANILHNGLSRAVYSEGDIDDVERLIQEGRAALSLAVARLLGECD